MQALRERDNEPPVAAAHVRLDFFFPTKAPAKIGQPHTAKPDTDNLAKLWLDAAQHEDVRLLPKGDERVASPQITKRWARDGGAVMVIEPLTAEVLDDADQDEDDRDAVALG